MRWLLFTDEQNSISKQCIDLLEVAGQTVVLHQHHGRATIAEIKEKLINEKPDRIVLIIEGQNSTKLVQDISHHLLIPIYVAQATTQSYTPIPILVITTVTEDKNLNIIQNATDQLITVYPHIFQ